MSDWGFFWLGAGFALGMYFLGCGIASCAEKMEDCIIRVLDHLEREEDE